MPFNPGTSTELDRIRVVEEIKRTGLCPSCNAIFQSESKILDVRQVRNTTTGKFEDVESFNIGGVHHGHPRDCAEAAIGGCPICNIIKLKALQPGRPIHFNDGEFTKYTVENLKKGSSDPLKYRSKVVRIYFNDPDGVKLPFRLPHDHQLSVSFALLPVEEGLNKTLVKDESMGGAQLYKQLWGWIAECVKSHEKCIPTEEEEKFMPKRLIDLSMIDVDQTVKLVEGNDDLAQEGYVALSHCWGKYPQLTLADSALPMDKLQNPVLIDEIRSGLSLDRLPPLFTRVAFVTRNLGKKYIWIDSLCIVQNSPDDWREQSALMDMVYRGASLTIAADMTSDGKGYFLDNRPPALINPTIVRPKWLENDDQEYRVVPLDYWKINVSESLLGVRGWALQERVLSPRVLHFGLGQVFWECSTRQRCQSFPDGFPEEVVDADSSIKALEVNEDGKELIDRVKRILDKEDNDPDESSKLVKWVDEKGEEKQSRVSNLVFASPENKWGIEEARKSERLEWFQKLFEQKVKISDDDDSEEYEKLDYSLGGYFLWARILEKYTTTSLTFPSDKLVAINGLSNYMSKRLDDTFMSGLWRNIIASELLWSVKGHFNSSISIVDEELIQKLAEKPFPGRGTRPAEWRAPTWSWASIDGPIAASFPLRDKGMIKVHGFAAPSEEEGKENPLFQMLVVEGALHPGMLSFNPLMCVWGVGISPQGIRMTKPEGEEWADVELTDDVNLSSTEDMNNLNFAPALPDFDPPAGRGDFFTVMCLPVMKRKIRRAIPNDKFNNTTWGISGLILLQDQEDKHMYHRIGMFESADPEKFSKTFTKNEKFRDYFFKDSVIMIG